MNLNFLKASFFCCFFAALFCIGSSSLPGFELSLKEGHAITISGQVYWMKRSRAGGSSQTGILSGFWAEYERHLKNNFYASFHFWNAKGHLNGHTGIGSKLKSDKKESEIEGRIGYCFGFKAFPKFSVAPFLGTGSFSSHNEFIEPSPLLFHMETRFLFGAFGFKSMVAVTEYFSWGILFEVSRPYDIHCKIKNHEELESVTQFIKEKLFYELEAPLQIKLEKRNCFQFGGALVPFYRYRCYGAQENFPFDYPKTRFHILGGRLELKLFF